MTPDEIRAIGEEWAKLAAHEMATADLDFDMIRLARDRMPGRCAGHSLALRTRARRPDPRPRIGPLPADRKGRGNASLRRAQQARRAVSERLSWWIYIARITNIVRGAVRRGGSR
jgi:hypothetical protein